jgi:translation elongation factor EF-G
MADDIHMRPPWLVEIAIEPKSKADREKFDIALTTLAAEDPSFRVSTDPESGQTILKGMGELHLDTKVEIVRRTYKVDANIGALQVAFRERITQRVEVEYTHKKILGPKGEFACVKFIVEPNEPGRGYEFESKIGDGAVKEYIPGIEKGLEGCFPPAWSLASRWWTSRFNWSTSSITTSTPRCGRSKSHRARLSAKRCRRASPFCSSRS